MAWTTSIAGSHAGRRRVRPAARPVEDPLHLVEATSPIVRDARRADTAVTARLHARWLTRGFFPRLGPRFLRTYHASFVRGPAAVALVATVDQTPAGFLVGTLDNERHYRWVTRHHAFRLALAGLLGLVRDPALLAWFLRTRARRYARSLWRRLRGRPARSPGDDPTHRPGDATGPIAVLTHVAVEADARGSGVGRALVERFVDRARTSGACEVRLISPLTTQAPAFYRALGWIPVGRRPASDGTLVEEFRLPLSGG